MLCRFERDKSVLSPVRAGNDEGEGETRLAGTGGAANAMQIGGRGEGQVKVDDGGG